jgi:hypothetical protein
MATIEQELESFARFAKAKIDRGETALSIDVLFDAWRLQHPSEEDALAIRASIRDMEKGEKGRAFENFAGEFRDRNDIPKTR